MIPPFVQNFPSPKSAVVDKDGIPTKDGTYLLLALWNRTGQGQGVPIQVGTGVTAAGTAQADATELAVDWNVIGPTPANSGVRLQALQPGQAQRVYNDGANNLNIYPASGSSIDALAPNAPYVLASGARREFSALTATVLRSAA